MRVVRAVAIGGHRIDHTGYILFESAHLDAAGIRVQNNEGRSDDKGANGWHRDLVLSGKKLIALTKLLLQYGETGTITKPELVDSVEEGIRSGELPESCRQSGCGIPAKSSGRGSVSSTEETTWRQSGNFGTEAVNRTPEKVRDEYLARQVFPDRNPSPRMSPRELRCPQMSSDVPFQRLFARLWD